MPYAQRVEIRCDSIQIRRTHLRKRKKAQTAQCKERRSSEHLKFTISRYRKIYVELRGDIYKFMRLLVAQCVRAFRVSSFSLLCQILQTDLYEGHIHPPNIYTLTKLSSPNNSILCVYLSPCVHITYSYILVGL